jgi:hypothetical protein
VQLADHDVSDPGVTLLKVVAVAVPIVVSVAAAVFLLRRSRRSA